MVTITSTWTSHVEPPNGMSDAEFEQRLRINNDRAWDFALGQIQEPVPGSELTDWELAESP